VGEKEEKGEQKKGYKVKTFVTEVKIFQAMKELRSPDEQVDRFIVENGVKKVISVSDTATTDNTGATIGLIPVLSKKEAALGWCANASAYSRTCGGKVWCQVVIPHDEIAANITLKGFAVRFGRERAL